MGKKNAGKRDRRRDDEYQIDIGIGELHRFLPVLFDEQLRKNGDESRGNDSSDYEIENRNRKPACDLIRLRLKCGSVGICDKNIPEKSERLGGDNDNRHDGGCTE